MFALKLITGVAVFMRSLYVALVFAAGAVAIVAAAANSVRRKKAS